MPPFFILNCKCFCLLTTLDICVNVATDSDLSFIDLSSENLAVKTSNAQHKGVLLILYREPTANEHIAAAREQGREL